MTKAHEQFLIRLGLKLCDRIEKNLEHIIKEIEKLERSKQD